MAAKTDTQALLLRNAEYWQIDSLDISMGSEGLTGGVVRLEPAPQQVPKVSSTPKDSSQPTTKATQVVKIYPFESGAGKKAEGLKFGGESKAEREEASRRIMKMYSNGILDGH